MGLDWWYTLAFMEELIHCRSGGVMMSILVDTDMSTPIIHEIGTPEQKQEFLAPLIAGGRLWQLWVESCRSQTRLRGMLPPAHPTRAGPLFYGLLRGT